MFIDLAFLSSIRGSPDASEALENQVNANVGEVRSFVTKLLGYILNSPICD